MDKRRLIMLYGFAGLGKTTLAKRINRDIPFSLRIEEDELLNMIGGWIKDENEARKYVYSLIKVMTKQYLELNREVIIPCLLTDTERAIELENIAKEAGAEFVELYIKSNINEAVDFLYERGTWGESNSIKITENDRQHIIDIYDQMARAMEKRKNCIEVPYFRNDVEKTNLGIKKLLNL